ncbi:hypothetical protein D3C80_1147810 [compost metagenome]
MINDIGQVLLWRRFGVLSIAICGLNKKNVGVLNHLWRFHDRVIGASEVPGKHQGLPLRLHLNRCRTENVTG